MSNKLPVTIKQDVDSLLYNFYPEALTPMQVMRKVNNPIQVVMIGTSIHITWKSLIEKAQCEWWA